MSARPFSRISVLVACCISLLVIGRNIYHRRANDALYAAVKRNDPMAVQAALDQGADPDHKVVLPLVPEPEPILSLARGSGEQIFCLLIRKSADAHTHKRSTELLGDACGSGWINAVRNLLDMGADPNYVDGNQERIIDHVWDYGRYGWQTSITSIPSIVERRKVSRQIVMLLRAHGVQLTLADAVLLGDRAILLEMLAAGAPVNAASGRNRETALHVAIQEDADMVYLLLAHGADPNAGNDYDMPLRAAIFAHKTHIARILLAHGADPNRKTQYESILGTAIHSCPELIPDLLAHGADVNGVEGDALSAAIHDGKVSLMRDLLRRGADINAGGAAALKAAIQIGRTDLITELLRRGADPNSAPQRRNPQLEWQSPLMLAVMFRPQYFDLLLRAGANPKRDRSRLLAAATMRGRTDFVTRLVAAGANVNASDVDGQTPLIWALGRTPSCVKLLLDHGANPNVVNVRQRTPLDLAAEAGDASAVRLLLAHGANVNVRPARAHTALYWARKKRHLDVVTLLQQAGATLDQ